MSDGSQLLLAPEFLARLSRLALQARRVLRGERQGEKRSRRHGSGLLFAGHRGYVSGDDLRRLDWDLLARLDRPFVRLFEEETDLTVHLLIDASRSMGYGEPTKFLAAARMAAALAHIALSSLDRVIVGLFDGEGLRAKGPVRGRAALFRLLGFLDTAAPQGPGALGRGLGFHAASTRAGLTVVFSDFFDSDLPGALLRHRFRRHDVVLVRVLAREEIDPPYDGDLELLDAEGGAPVAITIGRREREAYHARVVGHFDSLRRFGLRHAMSALDVPADLPLEQALWDHLLRSTFVGRR